MAVPAAVHMLRAWVQPEFEGIEWGSGRSTVWLGKRMQRLVSVDHDPAWFEKTHRRLKQLGMEHVMLLLEPETDVTYVEAGTRHLNHPVDLVLVDGRQRDACALSGLRHLREGGWLVLDNAERYLPSPSRSPESIGPDAPPATPLWEGFLDQVRDWRLIWVSSGVSDTAIWERPLRHGASGQPGDET